jgi:ribonuclease VapC
VIVDTSAVVAILNDEPDRARLETVVASNRCELSSVSYLEASIVLMHRRGEEALAALDAWIEGAGIEIVPFAAAHARLARTAYARYGKGRHPAGLNFGDCAAYALATDRDDELLYQGDDFTLTDVRASPSA